MKLSTRLRKSTRPHGRKTHSDLAITRRIFQTIEDRLKAADIGGLQFYVREGSVSVYGTVGGEQRRELIVSLLSQIPGVRSIDFQIQVVNRNSLVSPVNQANGNHHSA